MRKTERERSRLAIAEALRNARRPLILSDNPLIDQAAVRTLARERYAGAIMGEELALSDLVTTAGNAVLSRIETDPRLQREAQVLRAVLDGESVQAAARRLGRSREHISDTAWRTVTTWVLNEFERSPTVRYTAAGDGKRAEDFRRSPTAAPSPQIQTGALSSAGRAADF